MRIPEILTPSSLEEAVAWKAEHRQGLRVLAGGTDLIPGVCKGTVLETRMLDLGSVKGLDSVVEDEGHVRLGPLLTHAALATHPVVRKHLPILAHACGSVGSVQIRSRGTIGGNLANASPAADSHPALWVLGTELEVRGATGCRTIPLESFFTGPGETVLGPDEILTRIDVRKAPAGACWFYEKLGQRRAMAIAKVSVAFLAVREGQVLRSVRIALGAVAPTVIGAPETASLLEGRPLDGTIISQAAEKVQAEARPIADVRSTAEYRRAMVGVLLARGLRSLLP